jgi:hypothetical protein
MRSRVWCYEKRNLDEETAKEVARVVWHEIKPRI